VERERVNARRRSAWAPRLLLLSTVALALTAMVLEWSARRRA
jgi:hypothetical protein